MSNYYQINSFFSLSISTKNISISIECIITSHRNQTIIKIPKIYYFILSIFINFKLWSPTSKCQKLHMWTLSYTANNIIEIVTTTDRLKYNFL